MTLHPIRSARWLTVALLGLATASLPVRAEDKFVFLTNWFAEAEHGGFYQAVATGLYRRAGLDVTIKMGGPQVNIFQLLAAGQADCVMGATDLQVMLTRESGLPIVNVAAMMQKDPEVLIAHEDVTTIEQMKGKTILVAPGANLGYWPWLKARYGLTDAQSRPYTFNIQPFVADRNLVQQGYVTSEPYAIQKAGIKANTFLLSDFGFPAYATTVACLQTTIDKRKAAVAAFVKASAEGWKSYLANPGPGDALIRKDNPEMTAEQLAYSVRKLNETGMIAGGDAARLGIGIITEARAKASYDFMVGAKLLDPAKVKLADTYTTEFVRSIKVLP